MTTEVQHNSLTPSLGLTTKVSTALGGVMSNPVPTIGRIVHYTLAQADAEAVNRRREDSYRTLHPAPGVARKADGDQVHIGNPVKAGDVFPMLIVRTWGDTPESVVNGQVFLDGNDVLWVTSVGAGAGLRRFVWPGRA